MKRKREAYRLGQFNTAKVLVSEKTVYVEVERWDERECTREISGQARRRKISSKTSARPGADTIAQHYA